MKNTTFNDLIDLFKSLNILLNDKVMVHGFMPSLGMIEGGYKTFFDALLKVLGTNGTLIIPVFTYSYCRNEVYDVIKTRSTIGEFTNFFLDNYPCYRNMEPNFSMAAIGEDAELLVKRDTINVYGRKGIYQKIEDSNVKFLLIGINWDQGLSYSMHIEHTFGVDYRYDKEFFGKSIDHSGNISEGKAVHFVRDLVRNPIRLRSRIGNILDDNNISFIKKFQYGIHRTISAQLYSKYAFEKMKTNPYYLLKEIDGKEIII